MQHFWYRIKVILRSRSAIFWAMVFPVFLGLVFKFMFGNIGQLEQFSEVPVGIVTEEENDELVTVMEEVEIEEDLPMFEVKEYEDKQDAEQALKKETIQGYVLVKGTDYELVVRDMNEYSSLIKTFLDQYKQNISLIEDVAKKNPQEIGALVEELFSEESIGLKEIPLKGQDKDPYTQYFYALLAMACLIASMVGTENGYEVQADLSPLGARRNVAPTQKMKQVITDFLATLFVYCIMMTFVLCVFIFAYKQDFGSNAGLILLGTWVGSFTGLAAGTLIAVAFRGSRAKKDAIGITFFMGSSFLGGLQWADITYVLEQNCPIINRINPATLMVNSFKSLAVFGDYQQYAVNLISLLAIGMLFLLISIMKLRRTKYASL
ncbi:MAG: ABC transporter permease [Lachnospiraceae bacterium]